MDDDAPPLGTRPPASAAARAARHDELAARLGSLSDRALHRLVAAAPVLSSGIGGATRRLQIDGSPVFVKQVPLADRERRPENWESTANVFDLPTFCQYGVGSPGFTVWRELAAHRMTTRWILDGRCDGFPLLYHWRAVPEAPPPHAMAATDRSGSVDFWHGSPAVAERLRQTAAASASILLFLEHIPDDLPTWLAARLRAGDDRFAAAVTAVERDVVATVACMNAAGLQHFDLHAGNLRTDGQRVFVTDFGLATSLQFDLSPAEVAFVRGTLDHDVCHAVTQLVNWLTTSLAPATDVHDRNARIRRYAAGDRPALGPPEVAAVVARYAPVAAIMNDFYLDLHLTSRHTTYPAETLRRARAAAGMAEPGPGTAHDDGSDATRR